MDAGSSPLMDGDGYCQRREVTSGTCRAASDTAKGEVPLYSVLCLLLGDFLASALRPLGRQRAVPATGNPAATTGLQTRALLCSTLQAG